MKTLFFDCKNGISGDMVLNALMDLSGIREQIEKALKQDIESGIGESELCDHTFDENCRGNDCHEHNHHIHGRSWLKVRKLIENSSFSDVAKATALSIYRNIAEAEASVHGETLETIHFHEVGRDEAIKNALGIGMALEAIKPDKILVSPIYDGKGTVVCSHGEIPVPVPAVMALRAKCSYIFRTADVNMEMVTPSGLASLMGIGAVPTDEVLIQALNKALVLFNLNNDNNSNENDNVTANGTDIDSRFQLNSESQAESSSTKVQLEIIAKTEARGSRDTGREGLKVYLLDRRDRRVR